MDVFDSANYLFSKTKHTKYAENERIHFLLYYSQCIALNLGNQKLFSKDFKKIDGKPQIEITEMGGSWTLNEATETLLENVQKFWENFPTSKLESLIRQSVPCIKTEEGKVITTELMTEEFPHLGLEYKFYIQMGRTIGIFDLNETYEEEISSDEGVSSKEVDNNFISEASVEFSGVYAFNTDYSDETVPLFL